MKNLINALALALAAAATLVSCSPDRGAEIDALACGSDSTQFDFVKSNGSTIELKMTTKSISPLVDGFFAAVSPDGVCVYRLEGDTPVAVEGLSGLVSAGFMACDVMPVCRPGKHIELVDKKGETVASLEVPDGEITECDPYFVNGRLRVTTDKGMQGLVDTEGQFAVAPAYDLLGPISADGKLLAVKEVERDGILIQNFSVIDIDGKQLHQFPENEVPLSMTISDNRVAVAGGDGFCLVDVAGSGARVKLPEAVRYVDDVAEGLIVYRTANGQKGLLGMDGTQILSPIFKQLRIGPSGVVAAFSGDEWSLMKSDGSLVGKLNAVNMLSPAPAISFGKGFAFVAQAAEGFYLIDSEGHKVNQMPLPRIDYGNPAMMKVVTDYPSTTTPIELPEEEDWE